MLADSMIAARLINGNLGAFRFNGPAANLSRAVLIAAVICFIMFATLRNSPRPKYS